MAGLPIRLVALDLDGTVLTDEKTLSPRTVQVLCEALRQGVFVVPATGRTVKGIDPGILSLPGVRYAISSNGARIDDLQTGRPIWQKLTPQKMALEAFDMLSQYDCMLDLFQDGMGYTTVANAARIDEMIPPNLRDYVRNSRTVVPDLREFILTQPQGIEKLTMFFFREEERQEAIRRAAAMGMDPVSSLPGNLELTVAGVNKGAAVLALAQLLGLEPCQTMACGDGGNDIAMIQAAGIGVAMANGMPEVKAAADFVTKSNMEDGVAYAIEKFVFGRV